MLVEFSKDSTGLLKKMTSKFFVVPCLLSTFKFLLLGFSKYQMSGPLMKKMKIAVNYSSIDNLDVSGVPVRRLLLLAAVARRLNLSKLELTCLLNNK